MSGIGNNQSIPTVGKAPLLWVTFPSVECSSKSCELRPWSIRTQENYLESTEKKTRLNTSASFSTFLNCVTPTSKILPLPSLLFQYAMSTLLVPIFARWQEFTLRFTGFTFQEPFSILQTCESHCLTASMRHRSSVLPTRGSHQGSSYSRHPQL